MRQAQTGPRFKGENSTWINVHVQHLNGTEMSATAPSEKISLFLQCATPALRFQPDYLVWKHRHIAGPWRRIFQPSPALSESPISCSGSREPTSHSCSKPIRSPAQRRSQLGNRRLHTTPGSPKHSVAGEDTNPGRIMAFLASWHSSEVFGRRPRPVPQKTLSFVPVLLGRN